MKGANASLPVTLLILKPDAVQRRLVGRLVTRLEDKGLQIAGLKMMRIDRQLATTHYEAHAKKPFFGALIRYITSGPVVVMAVRGKNVIAVTRKMMGATFGSNAEPGTIRGDFAVSDSFNLIHGSDSPEAAAREIALYFRPDEIQGDPLSGFDWTYDLSEEKPV